MKDCNITIFFCKNDSLLPKGERLSYYARLYLQTAGICFPDPENTDLQTVSRNPWGKPYFPNAPQIHFSITHSGAYWFCAFGPAPLGLDLQEHRNADFPKLSKRFFHPLEAAYLEHCNYADFFPVWAAKESYVKYLGTGFVKEAGSFSVVDENAMALSESVGAAKLKHIPFQPDYSLCLCAEGIGQVSISTLPSIDASL